GSVRRGFGGLIDALVVDVALVTVAGKVSLAAPNLLSPPYSAVRVWMPAGSDRAGKVIFAFPFDRVPEARAVPPSLMVTVPVAVPPGPVTVTETVAVRPYCRDTSPALTVGAGLATWTVKLSEPAVTLASPVYCAVSTV